MKNIAHLAFRTIPLAGLAFFFGSTITIFLVSDDFGLFLGYLGVTVAYLAMFITVYLSEMTTDELKKNQNKMIKKLNKIIKMLEKKKP